MEQIKIHSKPIQYFRRKNRFALSVLVLFFTICLSQTSSAQTEELVSDQNDIKLGAFSISLNVKDLQVSKTFYENLGFTIFGGNMEQNYLIMKNGNALIGLFQGMFEGNMLTFNPGWDENSKDIDPFDDIRHIQEHLKNNGIQLDIEADTTTEGPASIMLKDPDGNLILLDQHRK